MDGLFDKQISIYRNRKDTKGAAVTLRQFLFSEKHKTEIERLRSIEDKEERKRVKSTLPMATISGLFSYRDGQHLISHSGLICIDIDGKDNPEMKVEQTKRQLAEFKEMAYIGLSVGGKGLFCVIPIANPDKHTEHFLALQSDFMELGITIDGQCKDITRARIVSFDPNPYVNEQAESYKATKRKPQPTILHFAHKDSEETIRKVYELCNQIQDCSFDITAGYQNWFEVGASLASMGEDGREAFHIVSQQNEAYSFADAEKKFDNLLRTTHGYTVGTFFHFCKDYGL